ncbi:transcriptional regulator, TetR family [Desulfovibrio sp. X2]|nr:transcriptional regulator, TetR family [Desulfovibrio sp. X2]
MTMSSKDKILAAARTLFGELGYSDTTFKRIAEKSGVALGLITHYFGSKEKLFVASTLSVLNEIEAAAVAGAGRGDTGLAKVVGFVSAYFAHTLAAGPDFMVLVRCSPYSDLKGDVNKDEIVSRFEGMVRVLADYLAQGMEDGSVVRAEPFKLATAVFAGIVGSVRTRLLNPFSPENFYDEAVQFIRRALAAPKDG